MPQLFTIIQGTGAIIILTVAIINMITARNGSGMARPFGRHSSQPISGFGPAGYAGAHSRVVPGPDNAEVNRARRYLCVSVDVAGYGGNDDARQARIHADLFDLLDRAGERAGLDRRRWIRQPKGDEELALIPVEEPLGRAVGDFCLELAAALWRYNGTRDPADQMRLRVALDEGLVDVSRNGFAGRAVVGVSRLVK